MLVFERSIRVSDNSGNFNINVKDNLIYISSEDIYNQLINIGMKPLYKTGKIWVFANDENILRHLYYYKNKFTLENTSSGNIMTF